MTALQFDGTWHGNALADADFPLNLEFGKRNAAGTGTDMTRFAQQFTLRTDPATGLHVARCEVKPGDTAQWAQPNQVVPCTVLVGTTSWRVVPGDSGWIHGIMDPHEDPEQEEGEVVWELHNDGQVKASIAPLAILPYRNAPSSTPWETVKDGRIVPCPNTVDSAVAVRICGGRVPAGGGGQASWHPSIVVPGMQPVPRGVLHYLIELDAQEDSGTFGITMWEHAQPVPTQPNFRLTGIPTMAWMDNGSGGRVHDKMYPQWGNYGYPSHVDVVDHYGWVARPTREAALAALPTTGTPPVDKYAAVRAEMAYFRTSSPHVYAAFDELLKLNP